MDNSPSYDRIPGSFEISSPESTSSSISSLLSASSTSTAVEVDLDRSQSDIRKLDRSRTPIKREKSNTVPIPSIPKPGRSDTDILQHAERDRDKSEAKAESTAKPSKWACTHHSSALNLVVCLDGTANQFSEKNTNVVELYSRLEKSAKQLTYYDSGIGTYAKPTYASFNYWKQVVNHTVDMAIAWNFERIVLSAYLWLSENYEEGARIFIFGFSRGAYQARVIAGMIERVGLLHKGNNNQIAFAYELYAATTQSSSREGAVKDPSTIGDSEYAPKAERLCRRFKETLSRRNVKVHFIGAWDTVSSIGVAREPGLPETTSGMKHICGFRHALALDERRVKFLPEYADGGAGPSGEGDVKEVWFAGSHSDIGGGNIANMDLDKFGPALRWMTYEAIKFGLKMEPYTRKWASIQPRESLRGVWNLLEYLPLRHLAYTGKEDTTQWPHRGASRIVQSGQLIHASVFDAIENDGYIPAAIVHSGKEWKDAKQWKEDVVELDPYMSATAILAEHMQSKAEDISDEHADALNVAIREEIGLRSIVEFPGALEALLAALKSERLKPNVDRNQTKIVGLVTALAAFPPQPEDSRKYAYSQIRDLVSIMSPMNLELLHKVQSNLAYLVPFEGHTASIWCVAVSPDGTMIASGSDDTTIRIWDSQTGEELMTPLRGHVGQVSCLQFFPKSRRLVSGGGPEDSSIRIWDLNTGELILSPFPPQGRAKWIGSVAVSPDESWIASGSSNKTIQIWDTLTGEQVMAPLSGHTGAVSSLAITSDGSRIISGSYDKLIRIWDAHTGEQVRKPLAGHEDRILCLALMADGKRILSGSNDKTVRIWDMETGKETAISPLTGNSMKVWTVTASPDGERIVSGSEDNTVTIWDANTGEEVFRPLSGHTGGILSVAAFPDGTKVVSSSGFGEHAIRVWDIRTGEQVLGNPKRSRAS